MEVSKSVPPVTPKSTGPQEVRPGEPANTGGDPLNRMMGNYSKDAPARGEDPFAPFDNF